MLQLCLVPSLTFLYSLLPRVSNNYKYIAGAVYLYFLLIIIVEVIISLNYTCSLRAARLDLINSFAFWVDFDVIVPTHLGKIIL